MIFCLLPLCLLVHEAPSSGQLVCGQTNCWRQETLPAATRAQNWARGEVLKFCFYYYRREAYAESIVISFLKCKSGR